MIITYAWTLFYAHKFVTFWMFPGRFYHSFVLQMTLVHFTISQTQVDLRDIEKHENMWIGVKRNAELIF